MFQLTNLRLLWVVVVMFWNSIIVLTPSGNFWDCATIIFSELYDLFKQFYHTCRPISRWN